MSDHPQGTARRGTSYWGADPEIEQPVIPEEKNPTAQNMTTLIAAQLVNAFCNAIDLSTLEDKKL